MDKPEPHKLEGFDVHQLERELDRAKAKLFIGKGSAFFGTLLCTTPWIWVPGDQIPTACTDGESIYCNPKFFLDQTPETRSAVIRHELEHIARMHRFRRGTRDPKRWNYACDYRINNDMAAEGVVFKGFKPLIDAEKYAWDVPEEEIYDMLGDHGAFQFEWGDLGDMFEFGEPDPAMIQRVTDRIMSGKVAAEMTGQAGKLPGYLQQLIDQFLTIQVPWEEVLEKFLFEKKRGGRNWARPNRRHRHIYLPSQGKDDGALAHIAWFFDTSGSMGLKEIMAITSEFKHVKDTIRPEKMTLVQFDTAISKEETWEADDDVDELGIVGGGGTHLACVRDWIIEHKPKVAIIFSDMGCDPMEPLPLDIPVLWIVVNNKGCYLPFGERADIRT